MRRAEFRLAALRQRRNFAARTGAPADGGTGLALVARAGRGHRERLARIVRWVLRQLPASGDGANGDKRLRTLDRLSGSEACPRRLGGPLGAAAPGGLAGRDSDSSTDSASNSASASAAPTNAFPQGVHHGAR